MGLSASRDAIDNEFNDDVQFYSANYAENMREYRPDISDAAVQATANQMAVANAEVERILKRNGVGRHITEQIGGYLGDWLFEAWLKSPQKPFNEFVFFVENAAQLGSFGNEQQASAIVRQIINIIAKAMKVIGGRGSTGNPMPRYRRDRR